MHEETVYPARVTSPRRHHVLGPLIAVGFLLVTVAACGIRVGQPPAVIPTADSLQEQRQTAAIALERVLLAAESTTGEIPSGLKQVAENYLEHLGGVWLPPARDTDPTPVSPALDHDNSNLQSVIENAATVMLELVATAPPANAEAYASMWLSLKSAGVALAGGPAASCTIPCGAGIIPPVVGELEEPATGHNGALTETVREHAPELIAVYDALGYAEEIRAARASLEDRDPLAAGAAALRSAADVLAGPTAGTPADLRLSAYLVDVEELPATIQAYAEGAVRGWLATVAAAAPADLPAASAALWHTYESTNPGHRIEAWPGFEETN